MLNAVVKSVSGSVRSWLLREAQGVCVGCSSEDAKMSLEQQCHRALEAADQISIELQEVKDKLKAKVGKSILFSIRSSIFLLPNVLENLVDKKSTTLKMVKSNCRRSRIN